MTNGTLLLAACAWGAGLVLSRAAAWLGARRAEAAFPRDLSKLIPPLPETGFQSIFDGKI